MLPRRYETIVAGSLFSWGLSCVCQSELDVDTLHTMVSAFLTRAVVGEVLQGFNPEPVPARTGELNLLAGGANHFSI